MVNPSESFDPGQSTERIHLVSSAQVDRVALIGEIDLGNARETESALIDAASSGRPLTVDLVGLTYLDSQGIAMFFRLAERARLNGGSLTLANPQNMVRRVVQITHLDDAVGIIDDV